MRDFDVADAVRGCFFGKSFDGENDTSLRTLIDNTIHALLESCFDDGNLPTSMSSTHNNLVQWCHGSPGLIILLKVLLQKRKGNRVKGIHSPAKETKEINLTYFIRKAAECVWRRGLTKKGPGLCHGAAGNGYSLLVAYRAIEASGDDHLASKLLLARVKRFGEWVAENAEQSASLADSSGSLFEGVSGACSFVADTIDPQNAWFPGSEV